jgi:D-glycero-D-manno-heptose 1,7-bisphosphate phosphatase
MVEAGEAPRSTGEAGRPAVFLDRDGVIVEDVHLLTATDQLRILDGVPAALAELAAAGFRLIVVSNQPVVARGLVSEQEVAAIQRELGRRLRAASGISLDGDYFCPHHPRADVPEYRLDCDCRKPRPGMLLRAAADHDLDLSRSFMVGDRITDISAGHSAGCRTVLVETGRHDDPPIETADRPDPTLRPDHSCPDLAAAAEWIRECSRSS